MQGVPTMAVNSGIALAAGNKGGITYQSILGQQTQNTLIRPVLIPCTGTQEQALELREEHCIKCSCSEGQGEAATRSATHRIRAWECYLMKRPPKSPGLLQKPVPSDFKTI